jgi:hypothetical protein
MYHIQMLQCSCYYIWNCRIRLRKSSSQLEKIVTLELESTDLEYCICQGCFVVWEIRSRAARQFEILTSH